MFLKKKPGNNPVTRAAYGGCLRKPQGGAGPRLRHRTGSPLVGRRPTNGRLMADQWRTALRPPIDFLARERLHKLIIVNLHKLCKYRLGVLDTNLFGRGSSRQEVAGDRESSDRANNRVDRLILTEFFFYRVSQQDRSRRRPRGGHRFDVVIRFGGDDDDDFFKENIKRNQVEGEVGGPWCQRGRAPDTAVTKAGSRSSLKHKKHLGRA